MQSMTLLMRYTSLGAQWMFGYVLPYAISRIITALTLQFSLLLVSSDGDLLYWFTTHGFTIHSQEDPCHRWIGEAHDFHSRIRSSWG